MHHRFILRLALLSLTPFTIMADPPSAGSGSAGSVAKGDPKLAQRYERLFKESGVAASRERWLDFEIRRVRLAAWGTSERIEVLPYPEAARQAVRKTMDELLAAERTLWLERYTTRIASKDLDALLAYHSSAAGKRYRELRALAVDLMRKKDGPAPPATKIAEARELVKQDLAWDEVLSDPAEASYAESFARTFSDAELAAAREFHLGGPGRHFAHLNATILRELYAPLKAKRAPVFDKLRPLFPHHSGSTPK